MLGDGRMGSAVGKLAVKNYETLHIPPPNSMDVILAEQARLLVEEMTTNGVGGLEIAAAGDDAGVDPDPGTPNKGEKEPEKEVPTQFHKRPDCAFYMKTGKCKFGPSCKFNHPAKRTKPRVVLIFLFVSVIRIFLPVLFLEGIRYCVFAW